MFGIEFYELFEHKDLFGQVHYFVSALCSPLLMKRLFQWNVWPMLRVHDVCSS